MWTIWNGIVGLVVHSSIFGANFGSFSISFLAHFCLFGSGTNKKGLKMEPKMMKNGHHEHPEMGISEKGAKMHSFCQAQGQKDEKWLIFSPLLQKRG